MPWSASTPPARRTTTGTAGSCSSCSAPWWPEGASIRRRTGGDGSPRIAELMGLLETIRGPRDLDRLDRGQLTRLPAEIREFLVASIAKTGGHPRPNPRVVGLTIPHHPVFHSPPGAGVFDTGPPTHLPKP